MNPDVNCVCGHPQSKHRKNGKCRKCDCTYFSGTAHQKSCRCTACLWKGLNSCELMLSKMMEQLQKTQDELKEFKTKLSDACKE